MGLHLIDALKFVFLFFDSCHLYYVITSTVILFKVRFYSKVVNN